MKSPPVITLKLTERWAGQDATLSFLFCRVAYLAVFFFFSLKMFAPLPVTPVPFASALQTSCGVYRKGPSGRLAKPFQNKRMRFVQQPASSPRTRAPETSPAQRRSRSPQTPSSSLSLPEKEGAHRACRPIPHAQISFSIELGRTRYGETERKKRESNPSSPERPAPRGRGGPPKASSRWLVTTS